MNTQTSNQLTTGLNQDIHPKFQEEGTYRFALNAILETKEGDHGTISNEIGNSICAELPYGTRIIGHALTENEEIILALFHRAAINPAHEIGIYNPISCTYTSIGVSPDWNFSDQHQVDMFVRIRNGCERVLYMTDNYNDYRVANITDTSEWITPGTTDIPDISKIKYSRNYTHPTVTVGEYLNSGGSLLLGTYNFSTRLVDAEGNATNWMEITRPFSISDDNYSLLEDESTYCQYDGGSNLSTDIGYVTRTNKAISLLYSNVDTRFKYFQVAVIKRTSTDGSITGVDVLTPIEITSSNINFIYTGFDSQIETQTSIDEILSENVVIHKVKTHTQLDSRLYLGNITNTLVDYTGFQRHASRTKVEYIKVRGDDLTIQAKESGYYFSHSSFLADEVYALGIVYVFKDGSISPVFHIPGRAPNTNIVGTHPYISSFTNWDTDDISSDPNVYNPSKTKRWQVYNTSTKYATPTPGNDVAGLMGYYETSTTYPIIDNDCDTNPEGYWGKDVNSNPIIGGVTKIRHHRMPSHEHFDPAITVDNYKTGIHFTINAQYPHADIVGHYFVHSDRTYEKTILDKGLVNPIKKDTDSGVESRYAVFLTSKNGSADTLNNVVTCLPGDFSTYTYISPKTTLEDSYSVGTYLRMERYIDGNPTTANVTPTSERYGKVINLENMVSSFSSDYDTTATFNYKIDWSAFLKKSTVDSPANSVNVPVEAKPVQNLSVHNNWLLIVPSDPLPDIITPGTKFVQVSLKADVDVFSNLFQISYRRIGNNVINKPPSSASQFTSYAGDIFLTKFNVVDYAFGRNGSGDVYGSGDTISVSLESELAFDFRHGDENTLGQYTYYKFNPLDSSPIIPLGEYIADKYYEPIKDETSAFYIETYLLNKSYNNLDSINRYLPLPFNYEFCNTCLETFPHRIYYSELDNAEDSKDNFRVIKPLNYQDLPGITGNLNVLFNNFSRLYALTDISPYHVPTRPQQLITDQANVYIGTSEVFGVPPVQLKVTDYHFGGSRLFKSKTTTEYGTFYVDDFNGRPFLIDDQLNDISLKGMRNFWQENGKLNFESQFYQKTNQHYPNLSTSSETGIGYISTYDPRFKRLIVHKKDVRLLPNYKLLYQSARPSEECIWFDGKWFYYVNSSGTSTLITFEDATYFENRSFTLSYSFLSKSWTSFHSYLPYYLFNNYLSYYSNTFQDDYIYKHLEGNHTEYYQQYYPYIIDLIAVNNPNQEMQYTNIMYSGTTQILDIDSQQYKNYPATFNLGVFYNSKQSTGAKFLQLKNDIFQMDYDPSTILVSKTDNKYKISNLRDTVLNEEDPIWNSSWQAIQSSPFNYLDKVPNTINLDPFTSDFTSARMKDYYLGMRLIYGPTSDVKMTTDIINTRNANRTR